MVGRKEKQIRPLTLAEVKEILEERAKETEFGYEQQTTLDYALKFQKLNKEQSQKLLKELMEIDGMTESSAIKIVDILPKFKTTLQLILAKDKINFEDNKLEQIMQLIAKASEEAKYTYSKQEDKQEEKTKKIEKEEETQEKKEKGKKTTKEKQKEKE